MGWIFHENKESWVLSEPGFLIPVRGKSWRIEGRRRLVIPTLGKICELNTPPLSSVAISAQRAGYEAAALLDQLMRGRTAGHVVTALPSGVVRRQSTDLIAVGDDRVARALRFIQENSRRVIGVEEMARAASLSRRALAELFREHPGRTVKDEIHRRRVEAITHLLVATSRSVAQIAQEA